jgi:hypothetical protein
MTGYHFQNEDGKYVSCSAWLADNLTANYDPDPGYWFAPVMWIDTTLAPSTATVARERVGKLATPGEGNTKGGAA